MAALLEARNVSKVFAGGGLLRRRRVVALEGFSMSIDDGRPSFTAVAGESGSGKTTLARLLLGLVPGRDEPTSGEVRYKGRDLRTLSAGERMAFRRDVQAVFQDPFDVYNPFYKVDHLLMTPVTKFRLAGSRREARGLVAGALEKVGLRPEETLGRYPHQLSGGQRQRVTIARALVLKARVVVADEPVSMIDASLRATVLAALRDLHRELNMSVVYITHDLATAYQVSESIAVLYRGAVVEAGDIELVIKNPRHPYTRELVASVPLPDPRRRWASPAVREREQARDAARPGQRQRPGDSPRADEGCKYRDACRSAVPLCSESRPPLYRTEPSRAVACHLCAGSAVLDDADLTAVLRKPDNQGRARP